MIGALVRKELRQLLPMVVGLAALVLWGIVQIFLVEAPDTALWSNTSIFASGQQGAIQAWLMLLLGLLTAYALLPGEHEQGTIEFLYTLPVRRRLLFLVKYLVGASLLASVNLLTSPLWWLALGFNPGSFARRQIRPELLALELGLFVALSFIAVAYGLLLAYFRRLGWLLFALIWLALSLLAQVHPPLRVLNVDALFTFEHKGGDPLVPWNAWLLHAVLSAIALGYAGRLWLGGQDHLPSLLERWRAHPDLRRFVIGCGLVGAALAAGAAAVTTLGGGRADPQGPSGPRRTVTLDTQHFRFSYFPDHEREAQLVAGEADRAYQRLQTWLPTPGAGTIVADLTEASREHAGIAGWEKLRLDVRGDKPTPLLHHLLYHETTHVLATNLLRAASNQRQAGLRFFMEGLAEYLAFELVPGRDEERATARQIAALARQQFRLRWEDLQDPEGFLTRHDEYLLYPLGEVWVAALVEACGREMPARVLRALGDPEGPQTLSGSRLWQHALQGLRCDLSHVAARHDRIFARLLPEAERLPRASAAFLREEGDTLLFQLRVSAPTPGPWTVHLRVRDNPDSARAHTTLARFPLATGDTRQVAVSRPALTGRRFEYQTGASSTEAAPAFFTRWLSTTLR